MFSFKTCKLVFNASLIFSFKSATFSKGVFNSSVNTKLYLLFSLFVAFIIDVVDKIKEISVLRDEYDMDFIINIDGGINKDTVKYCQDCDMVVVGSFVINSNNFQEKIDSLR